jgi:ubiquinone/menaquinone biosynthesis C-methylase UbiE
MTAKEPKSKGNVEAHYDRLSAKWDNAFGFERLNPRYRNSCLAAFNEVRGEKNNAFTAIELGAGTGLFTLDLARQFRNLVAVDISQGMLDKLVLKLARSGVTNVQCVRGDAYDLPAHLAGSADLVFFFGLLEHIAEPELLFRQCAKLLRPGGRLAGIVSNRNCPYYLLRRLMLSNRKFFSDVRMYNARDLRVHATRAGFVDAICRYWGAVPAQLPDGILAKSLSVIETCVRPTPLANFLGGIAFGFKRPDKETAPPSPA